MVLEVQSYDPAMYYVSNWLPEVEIVKLCLTVSGKLTQVPFLTPLLTKSMDKQVFD